MLDEETKPVEEGDQDTANETGTDDGAGSEEVGTAPESTEEAV